MGSAIRLDDPELHTTKLSHDDAEFWRQNVSDLLQQRSTKFPGAQPVSFARKHLRELKEQDYYVAEKTDGIRCLLYLDQTLAEGGQPQEAQFLIDRKNDYYYISNGWLSVPLPNKDERTGKPRVPAYHIQTWHRGTILDGELVRQVHKHGTQQLTYLMFDILALDRQSVMDKPYNRRIGRFKTAVYEPWKAFAKDWPGEAKLQPFHLSVKNPQLSYGIEMMFKDVIPTLPHGNDGLIFTCLGTGYVPGTDKHILKWKPPHENTVDFRLQYCEHPKEVDDEGEYEDYEQPPRIELHVNGGPNNMKGYHNFAELHLTQEEWNAIMAKREMIDWRIIECWRDADTGHWRPKLDDGYPRFRDDKTDANHYSVVTSVIESIEDAVSEQDLIREAGEIKRNWKARQAEQEQKQKARQEEEQRRRHEAAKAQQAHQQQAPSKKEEVKEEEDDGPRYED
ncbi:mRNA-capping enzyme subunit alpha [Fulvia fulva]|nr:mRNA-capping enzyme subunit alpha [Fulvia fulva]WPV14906.1 mRNA-capping enzyme subunit alpha [Fulvia fulva]WPV29965.1 mRNA-capping enzyme subunit alpha [Fulvia fulva]